MIVFLLIIIGVLLNTGAQLLLKAGMNQIGYFEFTLANTWALCLQVLNNPPIMSGLFLYVISVLIWLMVLSRIPVSSAYPLSSLGYILTALAAYALFNEPLGWIKVLGILTILTGVYLVAQN